MTFRNGIWNTQYYEKVLATDPIAYWIQDEKQGAVSYDMVTARSNGARNGAYIGVTLGQPGIGDGRTSPLYDGVNDYDAVLTASFQVALNSSEFTFAGWMRVGGAAVWMDGLERHIFRFQINNNNVLRMFKGAGANLILAQYEFGGVLATAIIAENRTIWMPVAMTVSVIADELRFYIDGAQPGATVNVLGNWDPGVAVSMVVGAGTIAPFAPWSGYLAHSAVWDHSLTAAAIADLAVV